MKYAARAIAQIPTVHVRRKTFPTLEVEVANAEGRFRSPPASHIGPRAPSDQDEADAAQLLVQDAVDATEPPVPFHGHWHHQNRCRLPNGSEVVGLAADGNPPSAAVLSVGDLQAD